MFVIDTNLLVYAANADSSEHKRSHQFLEECRRARLPWFLTWPIVYEFLRIVTHPRVFPRPWSCQEAWRFVDCLLESPGVTCLVETESHRSVAEQVLSEYRWISGNILHDTHTAILMREHGVKQIYTHDADFRRFDFLEVVDPLDHA